MISNSRILRLISIVCIYIVPTLSEANDCGSKEGKVNDALTRFAIPKHFPPDSTAANLLAVASASAGQILSAAKGCVAIDGRASLEPACQAHDKCYEKKERSKHACDAAILHDWKQKCQSVYKNVCLQEGPFGNCILADPANVIREGCRQACKDFVALMSQVQQTNTGNWCPSCQAWNVSEQPIVWSFAGELPGKHCVSLFEPSVGNDDSTHTWGDNYLCSTENLGISFSYAGSISGMQCTRLHEDASPHTWGDNYLCVPNGSNLQFAWSSAGPIAGRTCIKINEPADPHTWDDNYLCY